MHNEQNWTPALWGKAKGSYLDAMQAEEFSKAEKIKNDYIAKYGIDNW